MEQFKNIFTDFATPYLQNAGKNEKPDLQLKFDHSFDVFENSCRICDSLPLSEELDETARIAALFHDTGRFPQYRKYRTFRDIDSCNHGTLGARTVLKHRLLNCLPRKQRNTVLGAIALHNRSSLPGFISDDLRLCTEVVRDSDKIDIIQVLIPHMTDVKPENEATLMGLTEKPGEITESILQEIRQGKQVSYVKMRCLNDFRLLLLSWAYDLNFEWSRKEMIKRGYVDTIMEQLPDTGQIHALYKPVMEQLNS
ncbi:HD domain-containing protein [Desulfovibrio sp. JC010]|uniref:HD domain-containing protein n=1 Tax=Desulfovibrio sp. JC010 TaxID=2593641 RepID=UPI0013D73200|nr:HD domain-containing protein [Desulfovibrio sp. JC010]NDV27307.1 HD domain-containing protein [Desulfovibrio sp. JC010]